jgi:ion channel-forming bestrophin family protein
MLLERSIPFNYTIKKVKYDIITILAIGLVTHFIKKNFTDIFPEMPIAIPAFIGTAISVLLSFKLNQSYDRWWEARKIWGSIVNDSRTLVLQLQGFLPRGNENAIKTIAYRHIAWCYSLTNALRGMDPLKNLEGYLTKEELAAIATHNNKPLAILQLNTIDLADLRDKQQLEIFNHVQLSTVLSSFTNSMGMAERIKNTIFPVTYRVFLHAFIYLFIITLSISLQNIEIIYELPLLVVISTVFLMLENAANHMQDPFSNKPTDTAMTSISTCIEINIKHLIKDEHVPKPYPAEKFFVM